MSSHPLDEKLPPRWFLQLPWTRRVIRRAYAIAYPGGYCAACGRAVLGDVCLRRDCPGFEAAA